MKKFKNVQFHEVFMLISLDNGHGTLTMIVVNSKRAMVNIMNIVISLQRPKMSQLPTIVTDNHEGPCHFKTSQALTQNFNNGPGGYHHGRSEND